MTTKGTGPVHLARTVPRPGHPRNWSKQRRTDLYVVRDRQSGRALALVAATCAGEARARTAWTLAGALGISRDTAGLAASWCRLSRLPTLPIFEEAFFRSGRHGLPMLPGDQDWI